MMGGGGRRGALSPSGPPPTKGHRAFGNRHLALGTAFVATCQSARIAPRFEVFPGAVHEARASVVPTGNARHQVEVSKGLSAFGGVRFGEGQSPSPWTVIRQGIACLAQVALAIAATSPAAAQPADWRGVAPVLPIQGAIRPLTAPVAIGGAGWGPWRALCREQTMRPGRPMQRDCLNVAEVRPEADGTRLTLVQEQLGLRMTALRGADGRIREFAAQRPDGTPAAPDEARDALLATWRGQFQTLSLTTRRIAPREDFPLAIEGSARGGVCRPEGMAMIAQRSVVIARCAVELAGRLRGGEADARIAIFARVAVDVATGMVSAQHYATRIETFAANGRSNGVVVTPSKVVLE